MKKIVIILLIYSLFASVVIAQVGGVSGSKINAVNHVPIAVGLAEFEPSYNFARYGQQWNDDSDLINIFSSSDSIVIDASFNLRMAYAFTEELEFGCNLGADYSNWSAKYALFTENKLGLGLLAGVNFPFGFQVVDTKNRGVDQIGTYGIGVIASYELSEESSLDFNMQRQDYFQKHPALPSSDLFIYLDYGHYIGDFFMLASISYQHSSFDGFEQNKLSFSPGVSIEMKPEYLIVANANFDILGKNIEKSMGLSVAFTITL